MKKQLTIFVTAALLAIPLFSAQSQAFGLGDVVGKVTQKAKVPAAPAAPVAPVSTASTKDAFIGKVFLPDGSPADDVKIFGCVDMLIRKEPTRWTVQSAVDSPYKPYGATLEDGSFRISGTLGKTVSLVFFKSGYEPVVVKNVTTPVNLPQVQLTQYNSTLHYVQFGWFDPSQASPY